MFHPIMGFIRQPTVFWSLSSTNMYPSWIKTRAGLLRAHRTAVSWTGESLSHLTRPHAMRCKPANVQTFLFSPHFSAPISWCIYPKDSVHFINARVDLRSSKYVRVMNKCPFLHHKVKILGCLGSYHLRQNCWMCCLRPGLWFSPPLFCTCTGMQTGSSPRICQTWGGGG